MGGKEERWTRGCREVERQRDRQVEKEPEGWVLGWKDGGRSGGMEGWLDGFICWLSGFFPWLRHSFLPWIPALQHGDQGHSQKVTMSSTTQPG